MFMIVGTVLMCSVEYVWFALTGALWLAGCFRSHASHCRRTVRWSPGLLCTWAQSCHSRCHQQKITGSSAEVSAVFLHLVVWNVFWLTSFTAVTSAKAEVVWSACFVCHSVCMQDYCNSNQPISSTNWKLFYFNDPSFISTVIVVSQ